MSIEQRGLLKRVIKIVNSHLEWNGRSIMTPQELPLKDKESRVYVST